MHNPSAAFTFCLLVVFFNAGVAEKSINSIICPYQAKRRQCDLCLSSNDTFQAESEVTRLLDSYLDNEQIQVFRDGSEFGWYFNERSITEKRHIVITFQLWDKTKQIGRPIPGCCRFPLLAPSCYADYPVVGDVYYSLTLFRSSVIRHFDDVYLDPLQWDRVHESGDYGANPMFPNVVVSQNKNVHTLPRPSPPEDWVNYTRYLVAEKYSYVCIFTLDKETVLSNASASPDVNIESFLFKRGVYSLPGYFYEDDTIYSMVTEEEVECETRSFEGASVYNLSSGISDNDTFTCMVLWFTMDYSDNVNVRCMPHNATYVEANKHVPSVTVLYNTTAVASSPHLPLYEDPLLVITSGCAVGALLVFSVVAIFFCKRKKISKFIESVKEMPETLHTVMNETPQWSSTMDTHFSEEKITKFDTAERIRLGKSVHSNNAILNLSFARNAAYKRHAKVNIENGSQRHIQCSTEAGDGSNIRTENQSQQYDNKSTQDTGFSGNTELYISKQMSEDSGISSGISSGFSPLSEEENEALDSDIYNQVFSDSRHSSCRDTDSGLASSPVGDQSEDESLKFSSEIDLQICDLKIEPKAVKFSSLQSANKNAHFEKYDMVPALSNTFEKGEYNNYKHYKDSVCCKTAILTKTLNPGMYSRVEEFSTANNATLETHLGQLPEEINTQSQCPSEKMKGSGSPSVQFNVSKNHCLLRLSSTTNKFLQDSLCEGNCGTAKSFSNNFNNTDGYSPKNAFMLPCENAC